MTQDRELDRQWRALVLRLCAQILIKVHAGPQWGVDESEVLRLTRQAHDLALQLAEGPPTNDDDLLGW